MLERLLIPKRFTMKRYYIFDSIAVISFFWTAILYKEVVIKDIKRCSKKIKVLPIYMNVILSYIFLMTVVDEKIHFHFNFMYKSCLDVGSFIGTIISCFLELIRIFDQEIIFRRFLYHLAKSNIKVETCYDAKQYRCALAVIGLIILNSILYGIFRVSRNPFESFPYDFAYHFLFNVILNIISELYESLTLTFIINVLSGCLIIFCAILIRSNSEKI